MWWEDLIRAPSILLTSKGTDHRTTRGGGGGFDQTGWASPVGGQPPHQMLQVCGVHVLRCTRGRHKVG
jgi:hypothetical protein